MGGDCFILRAMPILLCPVRGCGLPLERADRAYRCPKGHSFDIARSGYLNLLQPQDRRSPQAGDPREAVLARRRLLEAGHGDVLLHALLEALDSLSPHPTVLDAGCGEGFYLGSLARERDVEAWGIDLSVPAIDLAARRWPGASWLVVNADRHLPWADGSFDLVLSLTARRNAAEFRRVLTPEGRLLVAVPGKDDLVELREAVQGERVLRSRVESAVADFSMAFELESHRRLTHRAYLDAAAVRDLLASTYRGARESERQRIEGLGEMEVTMSLDLLTFRLL